MLHMHISQGTLTHMMDVDVCTNGEHVHRIDASTFVSSSSRDHREYSNEFTHCDVPHNVRIYLSWPNVSS